MKIPALIFKIGLRKYVNHFNLNCTYALCVHSADVLNSLYLCHRNIASSLNLVTVITDATSYLGTIKIHPKHELKTNLVDF